MDNGHPEGVHRKTFTWALFAGLAVVVACAYWPGLAGGFLFDDFVNLNALGRYGGVRDWDTLLYYLTSGIADPTGRPVSLLTFLLDARDWPAEPWPFKRTNLVIHLLNGAVLASVLVALGHRVSADTKRIHLAALLAAVLWLLSPLWVSTVLYVIQRQAMLAALFMLVGIRLWIASRNAFDDGRVGKGVWLAVLAMPVVGLLAGLSKANGFLLPVLLACLELTVLRFRAGKPVGRSGASAQTVRLVFVWVPALIILAWLLWRGIGTGLDGTAGRPWSLGQRLLSQPRALIEYLHHIWVPGISARGVFADGFVPSRSLLEPWTTLPAMLLVIAALVVGLIQRVRWPIVSAAILFFFGGHVMESSTVMLELYFEHRNYLPAALIFWPLAWWIAGVGKYRRYRLWAVVGYLAVMILTTAAQARLWSDPLGLALVWAEQNPTSARAQTYAAIQERQSGRVLEAERRLVGLLEVWPEEPQYAINLLDIRCELDRVMPDDIGKVTNALKRSRGIGVDMIHQWLAATLMPNAARACGGLPLEVLEQFVDAATADDRPRAAGDREWLSREQRLIAHLALRREDCELALDAFNQRVSIQPRPEFTHTQVGLLASQCGAGYGIRHLDLYLSIERDPGTVSSPALRLRDWLMARDRFWEDEWVRLRAVLVHDS